MFQPGPVRPLRTGVSTLGQGGSMTRTGVVLLLAWVGLAGLEQTSRAQTQPAPTPQPAAAPEPQKTQSNKLDLGNAPTAADMYCAGFITSEHVSENHFVAA